MITLTKWQDIPEFPELELLSESGDYTENDLVFACKKGEKEAVFQFEAQFVAKWNTVYQWPLFSSPWMTLEQIEKEANEPTTICWRCWQVHSSYNYCNNCNTAAHEEFTDHP